MLKKEYVQVMLQSNNHTLKPNKHADLNAEQLVMVYIYLYLEVL